jgi:outer membrane immunogenic protein
LGFLDFDSGQSGATMKTTLVAAAGIAATLIAAQPATAADIPVKARPPVIEVWTWDGYYIGANGGYSWGRSKTTASWYNMNTNALVAVGQSKFNLDGPIAGGQIGFLRQHGTWVWGAEADAQWSGQDGSTNFSCPTPALGGPCNTITGGPGLGVSPTASFKQKLAWFVTMRGRLGFTVHPEWLVYGTGGAAIGGIETDGVLTGVTILGAATSNAFGYDRVNLGWTAGGGIEGRISGNWTAKLEYIYADYGIVRGSGSLPAAAVPLRVEFASRVTDHVLRVGLNYKWGRPPQ